MGYWGLDIYSADHTLDDLDSAKSLCKKLHEGSALLPEEQAGVQSWLDGAHTHAPVLFLIHTGNAYLVNLNHLHIAEISLQSEMRRTTDDAPVFKPHVVNEIVIKHYYSRKTRQMPAELFTALFFLHHKHDLRLIKNVRAAKLAGTPLPDRMTLSPTQAGEKGHHYAAPVWKDGCGLGWEYII